MAAGRLECKQPGFEYAPAACRVHLSKVIRPGDEGQAKRRCESETPPAACLKGSLPGPAADHKRRGHAKRGGRTGACGRARPPEYGGKGRRPSRGVIVRPLARTHKTNLLAATPPDRTETFPLAGRTLRAERWDDLCLAATAASTELFQCIVVYDPAYKEPWVLTTNLVLSAADLRAFYHERWPVEQAPLTAKQLIGAHRQFVSADAPRQRLPELSLLAATLLMYLAATYPAQPTGFWDRVPRPIAGRLRRVIAQLDISKSAPLPQPRTRRKKASVTDHLPKGINAHRRTARPIEARI